MKPAKATFILEAKRLLNRKIVGLLTFFLLLSLYMVQIGINNYRKVTDNVSAFSNFEQLKVKQYVTYGQYGTYGFRILYVPSASSIFFINSSTISQLTSNVDSGERLNIYNSFKGGALFAEKSGGFKDFSGIMLLMGSLLMLYLGYESFIHKDYLRFMAGFTDSRKLFFSVVLSRAMICFIFFLVNAGMSLLLLQLNGIRLNPGELFHLTVYLGVLMILMFFFLILGTIGGSFKSNFTGFVMILISWLALVFLLPGVVSAITSMNAENIVSSNHLELDKLKLIMDVENRIKEKAKDLPPGQEKARVLRQMIDKYWETEFREILAYEKQLQDHMETNIHLFQDLSSLFPSTFYLSASDEISSKGYENFIRFYHHIRALKTDFVRFYFNKRYPGKTGDGLFPAPEKTIEPFIKSSENLFTAMSGLPRGFLKGLLICILYIIVLLYVSFIRFKHSLKC